MITIWAIYLKSEQKEIEKTWWVSCKRQDLFILYPPAFTLVFCFLGLIRIADNSSFLWVFFFVLVLCLVSMDFPFLIATSFLYRLLKRIISQANCIAYSIQRQTLRERLPMWYKSWTRKKLPVHYFECFTRIPVLWPILFCSTFEL